MALDTQNEVDSVYVVKSINTLEFPGAVEVGEAVAGKVMRVVIDPNTGFALEKKKIPDIFMETFGYSTWARKLASALSNNYNLSTKDGIEDQYRVAGPAFSGFFIRIGIDLRLDYYLEDMIRSNVKGVRPGHLAMTDLLRTLSPQDDITSLRFFARNMQTLDSGEIISCHVASLINIPSADYTHVLICDRFFFNYHPEKNSRKKSKALYKNLSFTERFMIDRLHYAGILPITADGYPILSDQVNDISSANFSISRY